MLPVTDARAPKNRRQFIAQLGLAATVTACRSTAGGIARRVSPRILFTSQGKTVSIDADGTNRKIWHFDQPGQATWQPGAVFPDGRRVLLLSMEPRRDGPGRPFEEYYTQTPTHLWIYDLATGGLEEIATKERLAVFYTPALLIGDRQMLVQVVRNRVGQIFRMNLDGTGAEEFTRAGEGLPYGLSLSPDQKRVAFHLASPQGYQIWTSDLAGRDRKLVAADSDQLYFGPMWSPDGAWLAFAACRYRQDPGHDWADICISRPDGSERRVLTEGQPMWFAATYGTPSNKGGGSNVVAWSHTGEILFPRRLPGTRVPWEYQSDRPDTDHFNREYKPERAQGGVQIARLNPTTGALKLVTPETPGRWDFRVSESPDGRELVFCRSLTGGVPAIWRMSADGTNPRILATGLDAGGADHPRWMAAASKR